MNKIFYIILFLCFNIGIPKENKTIVEGERVDNIKLGMTINEINSILKSEYKKIPWIDYSYEYKYLDKGISIYTKQNDSTQKVFAIVIYPYLWQGYTKKGLKVNEELKIKDIIETYGSPEWTYTIDFTCLSAEYEDTGIYFVVEPKYNICDTETINHDSLFYETKVMEIVIGEIGSNY